MSPLLSELGGESIRRRLLLPATRRLALVLGAGLCALIGVGAYGYRTVARASAAAGETRRAFGVAMVAEQALQSMTAMESAYHHYMLTGSTAVLVPYRRNRGASLQALARLVEQTADNPEEQRLWMRVQEREAAWEREAIAPEFALRRAYDSGRVPLSLMVQSELVDNSRFYFDDMRALAEQATKTRSAAANHRADDDAARLAHVLRLAAGGATILAILGLLTTVVLFLLKRSRERLRGTQAALRDEAARLRLALYASRMVVWEFEAADGGRIDLTDSRDGSTTHSASFTTGQFLERVHEDDRRQVERTLDEAPERGAISEIEWRWTSGSHVRWMLTTGRLVAGSRTRMAGVTIDVTEHHALRDRLEHASKMEAIGKLAGGIAHDFNNLMSAVLGWAELATLRISADAPVRRELDEIARAAKRGENLVRQLLSFGRINTSVPRSVDINEELRDHAGLLRQLVPSRIDLALELSAGLPPISIDPVHLEQVITNLVVNARDAIAANGSITIATTEGRSGHIRLSVRDTGTGMDARTRAMIFQPFFTTKEVGKGTGLGLATVYSILQHIEASIDVNSTPGLGTTFVIEFPASRASVPATVQRPELVRSA